MWLLAHPKARLVAAGFAVVGLVAANALAFAPSTDKPHDAKRQDPSDAFKGTTQHHEDYSGTALLGDTIRKHGLHKLQDNGRYRASVSVSKGKITGMSVKRADGRAVPVTKYKTATTIGYGYIDERGDESIYWFPSDMIDDGIPDAIDYDPSY